MPDLQAQFKAVWGGVPGLCIDAPGRVNLMGDHIDYNGLAVLPMALQRRITLLMRPRTDARIRIASTAPGHEPREFTAGPVLAPFAGGDWGNYAKAAIRELAPEGGHARGFDALVHSDLPSAAGLSSSSALVVACALAFLRANDARIEPLDLAARMARAERYVGTRGGGMDQAICLGGREGAACRIDFEPLRLACTPIPEDWTFVVAHSGVRAEKSGQARAAYNERATQCREAIRALNGALGHEAARTWKELLGEHEHEELLALGERKLPPVMHLRFRHVVTEADRVARAEALLRTGRLEDFGGLLDESHESLAHDYDVSIPQLDDLAACARAAGAAGARLTGAGFGGCVIALCATGQAETLLRRLRDEFYGPRGLLDIAATGLFAARAGHGARARAL
jgi:galactokinase